MSLCASSVFRLFLTTLLVLLPYIVEIESFAIRRPALISENEDNYHKITSIDPDFPQEAGHGDRAQFHEIRGSKTNSGSLKLEKQKTATSLPMRDLQTEASDIVTKYAPSDKNENLRRAKLFTDSLDNVAIEPDETNPSKAESATEPLKGGIATVTTIPRNSVTPNQNLMQNARPTTESNIYSFTTKRSSLINTSKPNNRSTTISKEINKQRSQFSPTQRTRLNNVETVLKEVTTEELVTSSTTTRKLQTSIPQHWALKNNYSRPLEAHSTEHSIKTAQTFVATESESSQIVSNDTALESQFKKKDNYNSIESGEQEQKGQSAIYKVNSNYKRYRKLNIVPSKPFRRDPNDNSWRNESISSLGIKFKPKVNTTKGFQFRKKALSELEALITESENITGPGLRERLEKLSELRKSKKKLLENTSIEMSGEEFDYENSAEDFLPQKLNDSDSLKPNQLNVGLKQQLPRISQIVPKQHSEEKEVAYSYYHPHKHEQTYAIDKTKQTQDNNLQKEMDGVKTYSNNTRTGFKSTHASNQTVNKKKPDDKVKANQFDYVSEVDPDNYKEYDFFDIRITEQVLNSSGSWSEKKLNNTTNINKQNIKHPRTTESSVITTSRILDSLADYMRTSTQYISPTVTGKPQVVSAALTTERSRVHQHLTETILKPSEQNFISKFTKQLDKPNNHRNNDGPNLPHSYSYNTIQHKSSPVQYNTSVIHHTTTSNPNNNDQVVAPRKNIANHRPKNDDDTILPNMRNQHAVHIGNPAQIDHLPQISNNADHGTSTSFADAKYENMLNHNPVFKSTGNNGITLEDFFNPGSTPTNFPKHASILPFSGQRSTTVDNICNEECITGNTATHPNMDFIGPTHFELSQSGPFIPAGNNREPIHTTMNYQVTSVNNNYKPANPNFDSVGPIHQSHEVYASTLPNIANHGSLQSNVPRQDAVREHFVDNGGANVNLISQGSVLDGMVQNENHSPTHPKIAEHGTMQQHVANQESSIEQFIKHGLANENFMNTGPIQHDVLHQELETYLPTNIASMNEPVQNVANHVTKIDHYVNHAPKITDTVSHYSISESHRHLINNGHNVPDIADQIPVPANVGNPGPKMTSFPNHDQMDPNVKHELLLPVLYNNTFLHSTVDEGYDATSSSAYLKHLYDQLDPKIVVGHEHGKDCQHDTVELEPEYQLNYYIQGRKS